MTNKKATVYFGDDDREAIASVRQKYGLQSDIDAIRLALRLTADSDKRQVTFTLRRKSREVQPEQK